MIETTLDLIEIGTRFSFQESPNETWEKSCMCGGIPPQLGAYPVYSGKAQRKLEKMFDANSKVVLK